MLRVSQLSGFGGKPATGSAIAVLRGLGLAGGLQLCLDAGDAASYASGQPWRDLSGNGYDFNRGATSGSEASDPTFNGTAGRLSSGEYWSFDGGDYFTYDSANETWMNGLHKDNAKFTAVVWAYPSANHSFFGTNGNSPSNIGCYFRTFVSDGTLSWVASNGSGTNALSAISGNMGAAAGAWQMFSVSVDEGAGFGLFGRNATYESFSSTYASPSASNASFTMQIGARGNAQAIFNSGGRLAISMMWDVALTEGQIAAIFNATRGRFGA